MKKHKLQSKNIGFGDGQTRKNLWIWFWKA